MPTSTTPLTLSHNPTTITNVYSVSAAAAIYGPAPTAWNVTNTTLIQNTATTIANTTTPASGISLANGGTVINDVGATITAGGVGVAITGAAGTVINSGSIRGGDGVLLTAGGALTNAAGASIYGRTYPVCSRGSLRGQTVPITIQNSGTITSGAATGITLVGGGSVNNATGATIYGYFKGIAAALVATIANAGTINAGNYGISLAAGGTISNAASGTITGYPGGILAAGTVAITNAGTIASGIAGNSRDGAVFAAGTLSNAASGTISGHLFGVSVSGAGTIVNAGTIAGATDAVAHTGTGGRLVVDPGAVFTGTVLGGDQGTLELAGTAAGTLTGLGSKYVGFKQVSVDAGANWTLAGTNTQPVGVSLLDSGTLTVAGSFWRNGGQLRPSRRRRCRQRHQSGLDPGRRVRARRRWSQHAQHGHQPRA